MSNILNKELKLSASILSYLFIAFGLMFLLPGYPVLCGPFFIAMGIFQSFRNAREANDILFSALLPIAKKDVVKGKIIFSCFIELCSIVIMAIMVAIRMTVFANSTVYRENALMNANLFALAGAFVIFGLFNIIFIGGFFKTAYKIGRPFVTFIIVNFVFITIAEAMHHVPGFEWVNSFGTDNLGSQYLLLVGGVLIYVILTALANKIACDRFERIDL